MYIVDLEDILYLNAVVLYERDLPATGRDVPVSGTCMQVKASTPRFPGRSRFTQPADEQFY